MMGCESHSNQVMMVSRSATENCDGGSWWTKIAMTRDRKWSAIILVRTTPGTRSGTRSGTPLPVHRRTAGWPSLFRCQSLIRGFSKEIQQAKLPRSHHCRFDSEIRHWFMLSPTSQKWSMVQPHDWYIQPVQNHSMLWAMSRHTDASSQMRRNSLGQRQALDLGHPGPHAMNGRCNLLSADAHWKVVSS